MKDDILRLQNFKNNKKDLSASHFNGSKQTEVEKPKTNIISLLFEDSESKKQYLSTVKIKAKKPKLFSCISLALLLFAVNLIVGVLCYFTVEISLTVALIIVCCCTFPISFTYFFYKLDTRSNFSFLTVLKLFLLGAGVFFATETIFFNLSKLINAYYNLLILVRSVLEISTIILIASLFYKKCAKTGYITLMLIACTIASGFSFSKSLVSCFESLFIKVEIIQDSNLIVGAIINSKSLAKNSINNLFSNVFFFSFYQPLIFISLNTIIGFSLNLYFENTTLADKNKSSSLMMIILCTVINALVNISTSVFLFEIIYNVCSIIFTSYMFYEVLDYSVKNERYI